MNHDKQNLNRLEIDFCIHTLDTNMTLLTNPTFFPNKDKIGYYSAKEFPKIIRSIYRMLAHIYYHHRKLFNSLQHRYRIAKRLTLYCKKSKAIRDPKEYCINI
jgi:hypothetical protein